MDNHSLVELTYVLYRVRSTIIHGERWLMEMSRKFGPFYPLCKGWFRDLTQCLLHNNIFYSFVRRAPTFPLVKILFFTGERFAGWSSKPLPVYSILFVIGRDIRTRRRPLLFCSSELLFQIINLSLHGFFITLLMSCMTFPLKTTPIHVDSVHAAFLIIFPILLANVGWFRLVRTCLMWTWSCHNHYITLKHKLIPTDGTNCRATIFFPSPIWLG